MVQFLQCHTNHIEYNIGWLILDTLVILLQQDAELSKTAMERETLVILVTFKRLSTTGFDRTWPPTTSCWASGQALPSSAPWRKRCGKPGKLGDFILKPYEFVDIDHENGGFCLCSMVDDEAIDDKWGCGCMGIIASWVTRKLLDHVYSCVPTASI